MVNKHKIILIAAVDRNWAIGKNNELLYNVPTDMQFFREQTMNNIVLYGWKTLESFPQRKALPKRDNILLTSKIVMCGDPRMWIAHSIQEALEIVAEFNDERPVFICGGSSVYKQFVDIADEAYITKIGAEDPDADAHFPNLDVLPNWEKRATVVTMTDRESGLDLQFERYCRTETPFVHPKDK